MSGDVGRANKPYPGYAGYVPSWSIAGTTKTTCGPTERLNVSDRHLASQPDKTISAPGKTVYASDCAVTVEKKSPREPVVPAHKQSSPSKGFVGSTMQRDAAVTLTGMPKDDKYYTNLKKMQAQDLEAHVSLTEHNRKGEALLNSKKGRGGATGLACLHQPPAVSQASERRDPRIPDLPPSPKHGSEASPMMSPQASEGPTGGVKLNRGNMAPTSYSYTFGRRGENPRDRMPFHKEHFADCSTTHDLACGTAKSVASKRIPGYMGHVPSNPSNVQVAVVPSWFAHGTEISLWVAYFQRSTSCLCCSLFLKCCCVMLVWNKQCKQFSSKNSNHRVHPEVPPGKPLRHPPSPPLHSISCRCVPRGTFGL